MHPSQNAIIVILHNPQPVCISKACIVRQQIFHCDLGRCVNIIDLKPCRISTTFSSHFSFPASTSMATHTAVIALVVDAQIDTVEVSNAFGLPNSVRPYPF
jgi:hypothetical protein